MVSHWVSINFMRKEQDFDTKTIFMYLTDQIPYLTCSHCGQVHMWSRMELSLKIIKTPPLNLCCFQKIHPVMTVHDIESMCADYGMYSKLHLQLKNKMCVYDISY